MKKYFLVLIVLLSVSATGLAQIALQNEGKYTPDSIGYNYAESRIHKIDASEPDMTKRTVLYAQLLEEIEPFARIPKVKRIVVNTVDRVRYFYTAYLLLGKNYTVFHTQFDKLPQLFQETIMRFGSSDLLKMPDGFDFTIDFMEKMKTRLDTKRDSLNNLTGAAAKQKGKFIYGNYMNEDDYYNFLTVLCNAYDEAGRTQKASVYLPGLITHFSSNNPLLNKVIASDAEKLYGADSAIAVLKKSIAVHHYNEDMVAQLKRLYTAKNVDSTGFSSYLTKIKDSYNANILGELLKKMTKEKAPDFALKNLAGKTVRLSDMKGKVVVLDFWATWCGPCKESFPAMQELVNNYAAKKDEVAFFFIDVEGKSVKDPLKKVSDYIRSTPYTFEVLLDDAAHPIGKDYHFDAIPAKFVIDKEGFIRFIASNTFNYDDMKTEMKTIIDYLRN
jgi:thiol-disulfide isomerase/thioredoxin